MNSMHKKTLTGAGMHSDLAKWIFRISALLILMICILAAVRWGGVAWLLFDLTVSEDRPFDDKKWNKEVWIAQDGSHDSSNPRGPMLDDMISTHLRTGMNRTDVLALLGQPDYDRHPECSRPSAPNELRYYVGFWSGFRMDPDSLDLQFDQDGKLVDHMIVQH